MSTKPNPVTPEIFKKVKDVAKERINKAIEQINGLKDLGEPTQLSFNLADVHRVLADDAAAKAKAEATKVKKEKTPKEKWLDAKGFPTKVGSFIYLFRVPSSEVGKEFFAAIKSAWERAGDQDRGERISPPAKDRSGTSPTFYVGETGGRIRARFSSHVWGDRGTGSLKLSKCIESSSPLCKTEITFCYWNVPLDGTARVAIEAAIQSALDASFGE
jgi:hypothetical protein